MKKVFVLLLLAVSAVMLFGCKASDYKVDGEFMAFEHGMNYGAPMVTSVTVTIEKGKVVKFYIDAIQSTKSGNDYTWNESTKKELGYDYGMKAVSDIGKEWFEQAASIEAYMLEHGVDAVEKDADGFITNISGVSMADGGYTKLAKEALELAKAGTFKAYTVTSNYGVPNVVFASMTVNKKGQVENLFLDTLQAKVTDGVFAWDTKTKQELGYDYNMKGASPLGKEWFEQANTITDYVIANGWNKNSHPSEIAGVSVTTTDYYKTFDLLFELGKAGLK